MSAPSWVAAAAIATLVGLAGGAGRLRLAPTRATAEWRAARSATVSRRPPPPPSPQEWAALLDAVAADARSGSSLSTAWEAAIARHHVQGVVAQPGRTLRDLVHQRSPHASEAVVLNALGTAAALGGSAAATLDAAAAMLRERAAAQAEAHAHSAQARLSARVLTTVPLGFAAWSAVSSSSFRAAVLTPAGIASLALGTTLNLIGWWWMRRIVGGVAR